MKYILVSVIDNPPAHGGGTFVTAYNTAEEINEAANKIVKEQDGVACKFTGFISIRSFDFEPVEKVTKYQLVDRKDL